MAETLVATYRLQLGPGFGFAEAREVVPYLARLGVSHVYLSPILEAASGSTHGYDVVDPSRISDALGGPAKFTSLVAAVHAAGMSVIVDIVPNHMAISDARNAWWWDVLENGPSARAAYAFDVDWNSPERKLKDIVLVPVLRDPRGKVLQSGALTVEREHARFLVRYEGQRFSVAPRSVGLILHAAAERRAAPRLQFLADAYAELPSPNPLDHASVERRDRDRVILGALLAEYLAADPEGAAAVDAALARLNSDVDALDAFLDRQNYRLAHWRSAQREVDYRRFFDISSLVGLRVEDPRVFAATHELLGELRNAGFVDGVRVDHVDGLADPSGYLAELRHLIGDAPIYVEKILAPDEALRHWPIDGTTGYDFLNDLTALYIDPSGEASLAQLAAELTGETQPFSEIAREARLQALDETLIADLHRVASAAADLCELHRDARDHARADIVDAVRALVASFPVYRTYVVPGRREVLPQDIDAVERAVADARQHQPQLDPSLFDFLADILLLRKSGEAEALFVQRFQQLTAPAFAKGIEDTAFYRDPRLLALDEVGGDPSRFSLSLDEFHQRNADAAQTWPRRLLATSSHDTKRSEDVRARLVLLAEDAEAFAQLARRFFERLKQLPVDPVAQMAILQTLIGAWPIDGERLQNWATKAGREARRRTAWTRVDAAYERQLARLLETVLGDARLVDEIATYVHKRRLAWRTVSLGWTLLKMTCPGVPDFYQGNELFRFDLVDPDNRRAIDWSGLAAALDERPPLVSDDTLGINKLWLIRRVLRHRRLCADRFAAGSYYEPLEVRGENADQVIAFCRRSSSGMSVIAVPRWPMRSMAFRETRLTLPRGEFVNLVGNDGVHVGTVALDQIWSQLPVALLDASK
jgi:(1->4)-alpha-D-glucan 1-alpha-D-glucosylmutase